MVTPYPRDNASIGEQIARLRPLRGMTQEQLAERSGVSVDIIRKLEQGSRRTARLATLRRIAEALGVRMSLVLASPLDAEVHHPSLIHLRCALTSPAITGLAEHADDGTAPDLPTLAASANTAWQLWQRGDYATLANVLPDLVSQARNAIRDNSGDPQVEAYGLMAAVCQISAGVAIMLSNEDLAWLAVSHALRAAERSVDPSALASTHHFAAWIYRRQGRYAECSRVATKAAEDHEPSLMRATPEQISVWGGLLINASGAAARDERDAESAELLDIARGAAARLGTNRADRWSVFGPRVVAQTAVGNAVELGDTDRALTLREDVRRVGGRVPPTWEARYLLNLAYAQIESGRDPEAVHTLVGVCRTTPEWVDYHRLGRELTLTLVDRAGPRRSTELDELIVHMRLAS